MHDTLYLALVVTDFKMTPEVKEYFENQEIEIVKYLEHLGLIFLKSSKKLASNQLKYIDYMELESHFRPSLENY